MNSRLRRSPALLPFLSLLLCFQNPAQSQDVILQGFYWNTHPGDVTNTTTAGIWWDTLSSLAPQLSAAGFQTVWTPPPTKGFAGLWDMGYGTYDYFDLGSLPSKGTTRTRHGNRAQLDNMIGALHTNGLNVMCDVVLNHRGGADAQAMYQVGGNTGYNVFSPPSNRIPSGPAHVHPNNFHPDNNPDYHNAIFFEDLCYFNENDANPPTNPDGSSGSWFFGAPTLMGSMGDSLIMWGRWLTNDVGFDELRLDAVKHIDPWFVKKFLIESNNGAQPFAVGESFEYGLNNLSNYWSAVQDPANSGGVKNAKISLFDFPLRGALKSVLNDGSGSADLYNTLGGAGLVWATAMGGFDVVTWLESHDTDRQGYIGASSGCPIPAGASCLELHTENDHDPVTSDKEDMGYPFLLAAEGRPVVFWKDWFWYGLAEDIEWQIALRAATATGASDHIQNMGGDWNLGAPFTPNNHGGNMFALRRNGLSGGASDGLVLGLNDDPNTEHAVWVNTPFSNKYLKDYSDGYLFQSTQAFGDSRALIKAQPRDYSWWSPTGLYPKPAGTPAGHFNMGATPGGCPHFIAICAADAANLIVNGAPIAVGDEVAVKNAAGQVVGIGRIGQGFKWDGTHDLLIEALGAPSANGMTAAESFRVFVYDASAGAEIEIGTVQYAASGSSISFSPERPDSPNRNGNFSNFSINTTATGTFQCNGISRITAFNTQVAVNQPFCAGDNASKFAYSDGWQNGDNDGTGFGAWALSASGSAGHFISSSASNGDGDNNGDSDINTFGIAWGTYANGGGTANAVRPLAADLAPGQTFEISMDNGYLDNGASVGFGLQNSSGNNLFEFYYRGGDPVNSYKRNDNAGEQNIGLGFTDEGLRISFTLQSATIYNMTVTPLGGGSPVSFSGTLKNPAGGQSINRARLFNFNSGPGSAKDAFFNSIGICYEPTLVINEVDYDQPGATDNAEFIELKNVSSAAVNIDPYKLELLNAAGTVYATVELPSFSLPAGGYYVVCGSGSGVPNCNLAFAGADEQINDGAPAAIRLRLNNTITVDALSYEGSVTGVAEGIGVATGDNNTTAGVGLSRVPDGNDTNNNNSDFKLSCITPGSANVDNTNSDGDSYPDVCDNCPNDDNETQADTDEDGLGDTCDDCPLAVAGISNFNTGTCNCAPGYFPVTEVRNSQTVIIGCSPCAPGYFCPDGMQSIPCPAGKYSNVSGATECQNCLAGSYNGNAGATECTLCPPGKYSAVEGATECQNCLAGSFNGTSGATACTSCPAGKYSSADGATECTACAAGYFNPVEGAASCQACAAGYFSDIAGATLCTACPANTYSDMQASTSCAACGSGFYSPPASSACSVCAVMFTATPTPESCAGAMDGEISISNVTGGTGPFQYSIDGGSTYFPTAVFTGLAADSYTVQVLDNYGCESDPVNVEVTDNSCPLEFSGTILWEHDDVSGVKDATVNLSGAGTGSGLSDINGDYLISIPLSVGNYTLRPTKNINKTNGLTVADALAVQQHVTGITPITDPYKLVAADVNKSNSVSTLDATLIRQVLLGNPAAHAIFNTSWRFVPASYSLPPTPWGFPEQINLSGVNSNQNGQDFTGIKLGDLVSNYANPANFGGGSAAPDPFVWRVADQTLESSGSFAMTVTTAAFNQLGALQCAFQFDTSHLQFDSIEILQALPLIPGDFGLLNAEAGEIRLAWTTASQGYNLPQGAEVFRIHYQVVQPGGLLSDFIQLNDSIVPGLAYTSTFVEATVELEFFNVTATGAPAWEQRFQLFQNRPNPFSSSTTIGFSLPGACEAQLRVLDISGRELLRMDGDYPAGYNEAILQFQDIRASGILLYELTTPFGRLTRKMSKVD